MKKTKIILALFAGVIIGTAIVYSASNNKNNFEDDDTDQLPNTLDNIAKQFADKLSKEFKTAEKKINTSTKSNLDILGIEGDMGVFL